MNNPHIPGSPHSPPLSAGMLQVSPSYHALQKQAIIVIIAWRDALHSPSKTKIGSHDLIMVSSSGMEEKCLSIALLILNTRANYNVLGKRVNWTEIEKGLQDPRYNYHQIRAHRPIIC